MIYEDAVAACAELGWSLDRDDTDTDDYNRIVRFIAREPGWQEGWLTVEQTSRTQIVPSSRFNRADARRDEAFALSTIVEAVTSLIAERAAEQEMLDRRDQEIAAAAAALAEAAAAEAGATSAVDDQAAGPGA